jgi:hypothetical protein
MGRQRVEDEQPPPPAVPWILDNFIDPIAGKLINLEPYQRRILREALTIEEGGYSRYSMVVWSQTKKSGKTAIAGAAGAWAGNCVEQPNEISCVANDQEQSAGRIFGAMGPTLEAQGWVTPLSPKAQPLAYHPVTGSVIKAITTNYAGEAGGNQSMSLWSELWAYSGERLTRLWEEMTPPPTRKFSQRWVETYAGFINESKLLWDLYNLIFITDKEGNEIGVRAGAEKLWQDLPVYRLGRMLMFWDHIPRMPWQTPEYYADQRIHLRVNAYKRLHGNWWVTSAEKFITEEMWRNSVKRDGPLKVPAVWALDNTKNLSCASLVGCVKIGQVVHTTGVYIWEPGGEDLEQDKIMAKVVELKNAGLLAEPLYYDPYQTVKMAQDLRALGIECEEFPQTTARVKADTFLYKLYNEGTIANWSHPGLKAHVCAASAKPVGADKEEYRIIKPGDDEAEETAEEAEAVAERRIDKPETGSVAFVDAAVAQSMAAYMAYHAPIDDSWAGVGDMSDDEVREGPAPTTLEFDGWVM